MRVPERIEHSLDSNAKFRSTTKVPATAFWQTQRAESKVREAMTANVFLTRPGDRRTLLMVP
jgi:hypothetical protein